jgi:hypothetical protein
MMSTFVAPVYAFTAWMNARNRIMLSFEWYWNGDCDGSAGPHVVAYNSAEV